MAAKARARALEARDAVAFVREHGVVLLSARGPAPSLAEAVAGAPIRGSWWSHARGQAIFRATQAVSDSPDVLICRLVGGKLTAVHRRLWPALVALAPRLDASRLARVTEEHLPSGKHRVLEEPFPRWVPSPVRKAAAALDPEDAATSLGHDVLAAGSATGSGRPVARPRASRDPASSSGPPRRATGRGSTTSRARRRSTPEGR